MFELIEVFILKILFFLLMIVESKGKVIVSGEHCVLYGSGIVVCEVEYRLRVRYEVIERGERCWDVYIKGLWESEFIGYFINDC